MEVVQEWQGTVGVWKKGEKSRYWLHAWEVLLCKKDAHLYIGTEGVDIVLRMHREEDAFIVMVYDVSLY